MKKLNYTCNVDPINYDYAAQGTMKHLYFKDYKNLKNVDWGVDKTIVISDIIGLTGFTLAIVSIIATLFLNF